MKDELTAGALFAGIGGFCFGFEDSGFATRWAVESDDAATRTYRNNFAAVRLIKEDVRNVSVSSHSLEEVDVLHAGFPCQSFSQAGSRRGFNDPRGKLFFEVIRLLGEFGDKKPSVLVLENAPYLRYGNGGAWMLRIEQEIKRAGYWFRSSNVAELDPFDLTPLPQKRRRLFMVAFAIDRFRNGRFEFPRAGNCGRKRLSEYIDFGGEKDGYYYLPRDNRYYHLISREVDKEERLYQLRKYVVRAKPPDVCPTLTANMGLGGHNVPFAKDAKGLRKLTEYECAALQGFPTRFVFPEDVIRYQRYRQVGNAVAVPVAKRLAESITKKIHEERDR